MTPAQLDARHRVLCAGTVRGADFGELAAAAHAGGFDAISLLPSLYRRAREAGASDAELRNRLSEHDVAVAELDPLLNWVPGHDFHAPDDDSFGASEETFYRIHEALGVRSLNVVFAGSARLPETQLIDAFGAVCQRAARHGLLVHLEFVPWAQIGDVETAWRIVGAANQPNGGVMFDSWHHFRSRVDNAALARLPAHAITAIQFNDAPAQAEPDLVEETMQRRLLPGDGDIDLVDITRQLAAIGCAAPVGAEIFSAELDALPHDEAARRAGDSLRRVLQQARG